MSGKKPNSSRNSQNRSDSAEVSEFVDKVVHVNRCSKVVKGGRRFSFSALVVSGNRKGSVGIGRGAANEVAEAVKKATERARRDMRSIQLCGPTIPHLVLGQADGGHVMLRPASAGTGVIAGGGVRAVLEAVGVKDILTKSLRSNNAIATVYATVNGLIQLRSAEQIRELRSSVSNS